MEAELQPLFPVTVYVVVVDGLATTVAPVVALNPAAGDHVYELAPEAVMVVVVTPEQIVVAVAVVVITGVDPAAVTFTTAVAVAVQVVTGSVPVTVYVVAPTAVGDATTVEPVGVFSEAVGAHAYVSANADDAVNVVEAPEQMVVLAGVMEIGVVLVTKLAARNPLPPPVFCTRISTVDAGPRNPVNAFAGFELQQPAVYAVDPFTIRVTTSSCCGRSMR